MALSSSQLALLVEIRKTGSLARTALALDVSAPAVSQQLARLEKDIGLTLVERGARGASLTPIGEKLAAYGARVSDELRAAERAADDYKGHSGSRLRIAALESVSRQLLPEVLTLLGHQYPTVEMSVVNQNTAATVAMVAGGELDVGVCQFYHEEPGADGVIFGRLLQEPMLAVLPDDHPLAGGDGPIDLADLASDRWSCTPMTDRGRVRLEEAAAAAGFAPRLMCETLSYDVMHSMAAAGVSVAVMAQLGVIPQPGITIRLLRQDLRREVYWVLSGRAGRRTDLVDSFIRAIEQVTEEYVAEHPWCSSG